MDNPIFAAVGHVNPAEIKLYREQQRAHFTLKVGNNRFLIISNSAAQYRRMADIANHADDKCKILVLGYGYTYRGKCGQDHTGFNPLILMPLDDTVELLNMQDIVSQWFLHSVLSLHKNGHQNGKK